MKQNRILIAEKACTCPIEVHNDVNTDWQLLQTNIYAIFEQYVYTKRINSLQSFHWFKTRVNRARKSRATYNQSTKMFRLALAAMHISRLESLRSAL